MVVRRVGSTSVAVNGGKIRKLRKEAGMEIADLAAAANVTARHMTYVELGRKPRVKPTTFRLICEALEIPRDERKQLISEPADEPDADPALLRTVA